MKPKEYKIRNLGPISELKGEFPDNGVVYAVADNGKGKSTFIRAFRDFLTAGSNAGKISRGARSGEWEQTFVAANGEEYIAKFDFDPTTKERLTVITPEGRVVKKISDIRDMLGYPDFSVEEFISWGVNAEGRKKQGDVLFKMLPQETRDKYTNLALDEKAFFDDRTYKTRQFNERNAVLKSSTVSQEDIEEARLYEDYQLQEQLLLNEMQGYEELLALQKEVLSDQTKCSLTLVNKREKLNDKRNAYRELGAEVKELEERLAKKKEQLEQIGEEGTILADEIQKNEAKEERYSAKLEALDKDLEQYAGKDEELQSVRTKMGEALEIKLRVEEYETLEEEVALLESETKALNGKVNAVRKAKRDLFESAELPVNDLTLEDGELFVRKGEELFKFSEEEMCTSELLVKGIEIALAANPKTKILFLFNANLLNYAKREALDQLAKELDYLFLLEMVDESVDSIQLIAHEEVGGEHEDK